jgi:hypothetical protein
MAAQEADAMRMRDRLPAMERGRMTRPRARRYRHVTANEVFPTRLSRVSQSTANTPRPACSRVTTSDGRSPGSRITIPRRLPRTRDPSGTMTRNSPLTVAGAAADSRSVTSPPHSHFIRKGTVALTVWAASDTCQSQVTHTLYGSGSRCCEIATPIHPRW